MIIDFFASLAFYLVPYLTGRFFTKNIILAWISGAFVWFILFFAASWVSPLVNFSFEQLTRFLILLISLLSIGNIAYSFIKVKPKIRAYNLLPVSIVLIFISIIYFGIWGISMPYPMQLNWDSYEHITLANQIASGNISFLTTNISDTFTFNSYSPIFSILLSIPKLIFSRNLLGIYWWLEYWHFLLTAIVSFLLAKKFLNNNLLSIIAGIISALTFESLVAYSTLFLIPQTLVALIAAFILTKIEDYKPIWITFAAVVIMLMHYIVGVLCILSLIGFYLIKRIKISTKFLQIGIILSTLLVILLIGTNFLGRFDLLSREEAAHFNFSIFEKISFLEQWYGLFLFIFFPLGYIKIIKGDSINQKLILCLSLLILGIALLPLSYFLKFYVFGHYLINIIIVAGIGLFLIYLPNLAKIVLAILIALVFTVVFYVNQAIFKQPLFSQNFSSNISFEEIKAAQWLSANINTKNAFIISDPGLQYIFEAVSGVNSPGGAYMTVDNRRLLPKLNEFNQPQKVKANLLSIKDGLNSNSNKEVLFVLGGRYFAWQNLSAKEKDSIFYNIWTPKLIRDQQEVYINSLKKSQEFEAIYESREFVVFKVR